MRFFVPAALAIMAVGCHSQPSPTPPLQASCPAAGNGVYTALNTGSTATTYTDAPPAGTQRCYIAWGTLGSQIGSFSNTVGPAAGGATGKVQLSVSCTATAGTTCAGVAWVFGWAPAVVPLSPAVPSMGSPTTSEVAPPNMSPLVLAKSDPGIRLSVKKSK